MYRQIDGVAMSSPFGPALANIFVGYYESLLFRRVKKPMMYYRYMNDTFAIFDNENDCDEFLNVSQRRTQRGAHGYTIYLSIHNLVETEFNRFSCCLHEWVLRPRH